MIKLNNPGYLKNINIPLTDRQKVLVEQLLSFGMANWDGNGLLLLAPEQLPKVPNGTVLTCISGRTVVKGTDQIDGDTRGGVLAYGIMPSQYEDMFEWLDA